MIELLTVLSVLAALLVLGLPAMQSVREAARAAGCRQRLQQVGLALQAYHGVANAFPVGCMEYRFARPDQRQLAWNVSLLPHLNQASVFDRIDSDQAFDAPDNAEAAATILEVFICPSGTRGASLESGRGPTDYGGLYGERITGPNDPPRGVLIHDRAIRMVDVRDGTAHTLIVSEDTGWRDGQWINGRNLFDQAFPINAAPRFENDIRSQHPGGAHGLYCDGSVQFLSEAVDLRTLAAWCTRNGGEVARE